jgi:hypothetical protein
VLDQIGGVADQARISIFPAGSLKSGSPLVLSDSGKITEVVLGTIDGDPGVRPGEHSFMGSKALWYEIVDALPQCEEWPPGIAP